MDKKPSITVNQLINESGLCPVRVIYEGIIIYDDTGEDLIDDTVKYLIKPVYKFKAEVVQFHHTILEINY